MYFFKTVENYRNYVIIYDKIFFYKDEVYNEKTDN